MARHLVCSETKGNATAVIRQWTLFKYIFDHCSSFLIDLIRVYYPECVLHSVGPSIQGSCLERARESTHLSTKEEGNHKCQSRTYWPLHCLNYPVNAVCQTSMQEIIKTIISGRWILYIQDILSWPQQYKMFSQLALWSKSSQRPGQHYYPIIN